VDWSPLAWWRAAERRLWGSPPDALAPLPARLVRLVQLGYVLARDLASGTLNLHAMSLVYTTLLSMVPLLALSFSVLKAFGVHNQIEPLLANLLAPLGPEGVELTRHVIGFIGHMNVGVLGSLGLALLLYTAVSLMQKIEESFNFIWHVTAARSMSDRFSRYLSVLLVGPILVFAALGITAAVVNSTTVRDVLAIEPLGRLYVAAGKLAPYLLVIGAFTFLYVFIPNTRVRVGPAFVAGLVAGVLWQTAGWVFAAFVASSTHYAAIYSGFAILVLFLIWVYVSWLILLFGAAVAFYLQNPAYVVALPGEPRLSNRMRERLALAVMSLVAGRYLVGGPPWTLQQLTERLRVPMYAVEVVLDTLARGGVLARSASDPPAYLPTRDLGRVSVAQLLTLVRAAGEDRFLSPDALPVPDEVAGVIARVEDGIDASLDHLMVTALAAARAADGSDAGGITLDSHA
jgi:membrane protein